MKLLKLVAVIVYAAANKLSGFLRSDTFKEVLEESPERKNKLSAVEKEIERASRGIQDKNSQ